MFCSLLGEGSGEMEKRQRERERETKRVWLMWVQVEKMKPGFSQSTHLAIFTFALVSGTNCLGIKF